MRTQADDLRDEVKKIELQLHYCSDPIKRKHLFNKLCDVKSILININ